MKMTREHYEELATKRDSGKELTDEDRRFLKMYESPKPAGGPVAGTHAYDLVHGEQPESEEDDELGKGKYEGLTYAEVQKQAKDRGVNAGGTHEEIVARLVEADEKQD